jgi:exopolyphosphatase/guanosine-5'-triphosphate,3'-diphosphate pyrophosphatase
MPASCSPTELSWVDLAMAENAPPGPRQDSDHALRTSRKLPRPRYWISIPIGVVNLAERFPEPDSDNGHDTVRAWFEDMVEDVSAAIRDFTAPSPLREAFTSGEAYIVGTSGAITSLAGMHLGLERYDRSKVDGLWLNQDHVTTVVDRLLSLGKAGRELEPCIGRDRADLVLAGAAILEAVQRLWPCERLRVADRGLREGLLISMGKQKSRRRRRRGKPAKTAV